MRRRRAGSFREAGIFDGGRWQLLADARGLMAYWPFAAERWQSPV